MNREIPAPANTIADAPVNYVSPRTAILTGPTATGKTALALELARIFDSAQSSDQITQNSDTAASSGHSPRLEIINADSLLVYREMQVGTAKPSAQELAQAPHHLIDIRSPDEPYTAGHFVRDVHTTLDEIHARGNRALIVGGTGFYLKALLFGMWDAPKADPALRADLSSLETGDLFQELQKTDPTSAARIGPTDRYRMIRALELFKMTGRTATALEAEQNKTPNPQFELWFMDRSTEDLAHRITTRTREMLSQGLVQETEALTRKYPDSRALNSVGYAQVQAFLRGEKPAGRKTAPGLEGLRQEIELATRQLVKSQRTFFRGLKTGAWFELPAARENIHKAFHSLYFPHSPAPHFGATETLVP